MRKSDLQKQALGDKIVKCGCGLPMRQKNWADHWNGCHVGSSVEVTEDDVQALLANEERLRKSHEEHQQWLAERNEAIRTGKIDCFGRQLA